MPLFDFQCEFCNVIEEHLVNSNDKNPTCHYCQGSTIKLLSVPANFTGERIRYVNAKLDRVGASHYKD